MNSSVTVTYNPDMKCLKKQLQSLQKQLDYCVLVDNGSKNVNEVEVLIESFGYVLIKLNSNHGLAYAQNIGIENVIQNNSDYILLLDQDSILDDGFIDNIHTVYVKYQPGILGASFYDPLNNKVYPGTDYKGPFISRAKIDEFTLVTFVIASGSYFSVAVYNDIGGMKNELFVDYIDVEWSLRAKSKGYSVGMTNKASMAHTIGDARLNFLGRTISIHSALRRYYLVRNSFYMLRLNYVPFGYKVRELFLNIARSVLSLCYSQNKKEFLVKIVQGICDGVSKKYGSYNDR